jgi:hypothetical protein
MILSLKRVDASGRTTHGGTCTQEGSSSSLSKHDERITGYWRHRETLGSSEKVTFILYSASENAYAVQGSTRSKILQGVNCPLIRPFRGWLFAF